MAPIMIQSAYSQTHEAGSEKNSPFGFSVYALTGILYGQGEEIVYWNSEESDYKSQLLWDIKPLAYAGVGLSFSVNENRDALGFYTNASFRAGIPLRTGKMEDRDWQLSSDHSILTNYSVHENYTTKAFLADLALGISLPLKHKERILAFFKLEVALSYMYFDWMARNGYYQYDPNSIQPWNPSYPSYPLYGDVCAYYQHWLAVSPGIAVTIPIRSRWVVEVSLNTAPGLIWNWSLDKHIDARTEYQDYPTGGVLLEGRGEVSYSFNTHLALAGRLSFRHIGGSRGDGLQIGGRYPGWYYNTAGAGFRALDAGLTLKVFF